MMASVKVTKTVKWVKAPLEDSILEENKPINNKKIQI